MSSSTLAHSSFTTKAPAVLPAKPAQVTVENSGTLSVLVSGYALKGPLPIIYIEV
jgi:hypothetical protein